MAQKLGRARRAPRRSDTSKDPARPEMVDRQITAGDKFRYQVDLLFSRARSRSSSPWSSPPS